MSPLAESLFSDPSGQHFHPISPHLQIATKPAKPGLQDEHFSTEFAFFWAGVGGGGEGICIHWNFLATEPGAWLFVLEYFKLELYSSNALTSLPYRKHSKMKDLY